MPLVDPGSDRHQFHGIHADFFQVRDDGGMSQRRDGAPYVFRHFGMQFAEGFDRKFVNQPAFGKKRRLAFGRFVL